MSTSVQATPPTTPAEQYKGNTTAATIEQLSDAKKTTESSLKMSVSKASVASKLDQPPTKTSPATNAATPKKWVPTLSTIKEDPPLHPLHRSKSAPNVLESTPYEQDPFGNNPYASAKSENARLGTTADTQGSSSGLAAARARSSSSSSLLSDTLSQSPDPSSARGGGGAKPEPLTIETSFREADQITGTNTTPGTSSGKAAASAPSAHGTTNQSSPGMSTDEIIDAKQQQKGTSAASMDPAIKNAMPTENATRVRNDMGAGGTCGKSSVFNKGSQGLCDTAGTLMHASSTMMFLPMLFTPPPPPAEVTLPGQTQAAQSLTAINQSDTEAHRTQGIQTMMAGMGGAVTALGMRTVAGLSTNAAQFQAAQSQSTAQNKTGDYIGDAHLSNTHGHIAETQEEGGIRANWAKFAGANEVAYQKINPAGTAAEQAEERAVREQQESNHLARVNTETNNALQQANTEMTSQKSQAIMATGFAAIMTAASVMQIQSAQKTLEKNEQNRQALLSLQTAKVGATPPAAPAAKETKMDAPAATAETNKAEATQAPAESKSETKENNLGNGVTPPTQPQLPNTDKAGEFKPSDGAQIAANNTGGMGNNNGLSTPPANNPADQKSNALAAPVDGSAFESGATPGSGGAGGGGGGSAAHGGPDLNQLMDMMAQKPTGEEDGKPARNILFADKDEIPPEDAVFAGSDRNLFKMISEAMYTKSRDLMVQ